MPRHNPVHLALFSPFTKTTEVTVILRPAINITLTTALAFTVVAGSTANAETTKPVERQRTSGALSVSKRYAPVPPTPKLERLPAKSARTTTELAAQARSAGLTPAQTSYLQSRVDRYLKKSGGTQVAINKIDLGKGNFLLLALPGEKRAREIDTPKRARAAAQNFCYYRYFCAYSKVNFNGDAQNMSSCGYQILVNSDWGAGSWANNQTKGLEITRAVMYSASNQNKVIYTTPVPYSEDRHGNWSKVGWVVPCTQ